ncbi:MAG: hypothetical protein EOO41_02690, partial [Methanobacteriota archaeon]
MSTVAVDMPLPPPYDPDVPIESFWLPRQHTGQLDFGGPVRNSSSTAPTGHPLWPGVYQVRLYTVDPGMTPTLSGIQLPHAPTSAGHTSRASKPGDKLNSKPGASVIAEDVVRSKCVAVSGKILATPRMPPRTPSLRSLAPLRREVRVYLAAPCYGSHAERDIIWKRVLPQLRALCEARGVALTLVDLRQRLFHKLEVPAALLHSASPVRGGASEGGVSSATSPRSGGPRGHAGTRGSRPGSGSRGRRSSIGAEEFLSPAKSPARGGHISSSSSVAGASGSGANTSSRRVSFSSSNAEASGASYIYQADMRPLLCEALHEIEECRPFVFGIFSPHYDWLPQALSLPPWLGYAFPWLKSYVNPAMRTATGNVVLPAATLPDDAAAMDDDLDFSAARAQQQRSRRASAAS